MDTVLMGYGLPDDRIHAPNEKMDLDFYYAGIKTCAVVYERLGEEVEERRIELIFDVDGKRSATIGKASKRCRFWNRGIGGGNAQQRTMGCQRDARSDELIQQGVIRGIDYSIQVGIARDPRVAGAQELVEQCVIGGIDHSVEVDVAEGRCT